VTRSSADCTRCQLDCVNLTARVVGRACAHVRLTAAQLTAPRARQPDSAKCVSTCYPGRRLLSLGARSRRVCAQRASAMSEGAPGEARRPARGAAAAAAQAAAALAAAGHACDTSHVTVARARPAKPARSTQARAERFTSTLPGRLHAVAPSARTRTPRYRRSCSLTRLAPRHALPPALTARAARGSNASNHPAPSLSRPFLQGAPHPTPALASARARALLRAPETARRRAQPLSSRRQQPSPSTRTASWRLGARGSRAPWPVVAGAATAYLPAAVRRVASKLAHPARTHAVPAGTPAGTWGPRLPSGTETH
jgi:hypothetical protein